MKIRFSPLMPLLAILVLLSSCSGNKSITEEFLAGDWYAVKGDVESYTFMLGDSTNDFTGYLHDRPVTAGNWKFEGDKLQFIYSDGSELTRDFSISNDTLFMNNRQEIYTRKAPIQ